MDLIEKFIQENPSISKAKTDTYTAPSLAKMSVVDNDDLVTENTGESLHETRTLR
jgi:hypothetical protein